MDNIFEELKALGFDNLGNAEVFATDQKKKSAEHSHKNAVTSLEDILYDKTYVCPICDKVFTSKAIRSGKNKLMSIDTDLKPQYDHVNPIIYECIVCLRCGYAALGKAFGPIPPRQISWVKEQVCSKYKGQDYPDIMTHDHAIERYKLALLNAMVKKAKDGEKAYLCLKIAWLYRDLKNQQQEEVFLKYALTGFLNAYNNERFPIFELDELTTAYIISDLYRRFKEYDKALQWVGCVILERNASLKLKTRALHLKSLIREEKSAQVENQSKSK
ncbi:DUF2225 domain-containing protein [Cellulosilyticum sp. I15G10I2]|uniref:DUF2225 domain-containing protein n=1 Tax=Cellulosilyticum sp. I15G10I2 TaxID=1892843 RepID=UPI00085BAF5B|nr:DUF2225 domain-containing protein [Cellulosilyticum sp. I15G10I2]